MKSHLCCTVPHAATPAAIWNRPALPEVSYRIGTFASFRQSMIEAIAGARVEIDGVTLRPLVDWTARTSDDFGILILELWAYVADVLTFYQERTINESLLRTARFRESVLGLCRLLDYRPAPGAAASVLLAFTLERGKQLTIPVGLKVQSVPAANEKPQKFETVQSRRADAARNQFRIFPRPKTAIPLEKDRVSMWLENKVELPTPLVKNDTLVAFRSGTNDGVEEKRVESVETIDGRRRLTFAPKFQKTFLHGTLFRWHRKLRLFGTQLPQSYLTSAPDPSNPRILIWTTTATALTLASNLRELELEGVYDHLKAGVRLLVSAPEGQQLHTVAKVDQVHRSRGPFSATITLVTLGRDLGMNVADLRAVVLYELAEPELVADPFVFDETLAGNRIYLQPEAANGIEPEDLLIVDDESGKGQSVTVTGVDTVAGYTELTISPALDPPLDQKKAIAWGNVVRATHGETVANEILGDGDAAQSFQTFALAKAPVTFVRSPAAPGGVVSTLEIRVDQILWREVPTLFGQGRSRVFTTTRDNNEVTTARFGDHSTGARTTTGRANVVARYRYGLGQAGNVVAGAIRNPLDRPTGLKAVVNPLNAVGGADAETLEQARENAPNTVRTFGRIVSLRDFEDAAREFPGIARARATIEWDGEETAVQLTVAGDNGTRVTGELLRDLTTDLDSRRDPNRKLTLRPHRAVPIRLQVAIVVQADFDAILVTGAVAEALRNRFAFANTALGQAVHLSDVYRVVQNVEGVVAADVDTLQYKRSADLVSHGGSSAPRQNRLRMFADEIPELEQSVDLQVTLTAELH